MSQKTDKWIEENKQEIIEQLRALVRIPSVQGPAIEASPAKPAPAPGYPPTPAVPASPFGANVRKAEDYMLKIIAENGFDARENDGYYALAEQKDKDDSKETLGIICHLDVVPEGNGWSQPPYSSNIVGDTIYGRGTVDDKGPAIASLYALKAVRECGYSFKRNVQLIFGLNEENGMLCVEKYCECEKLPDITFSPDGSYPVCNSEFGIAHAVFKKEYKSEINFKAGEAANIVPNIATASVNGKELKTTGIQAHASTPWAGENAAQKMIQELAKEKLSDEDRKVIDVLSKHLGTGYFGEGFGIEFEDQTGKLTCNLGIVDWNENGFTIVLDLRCPNAVKEDDVKNALSAAFSECGADLAHWSFSNGYYLSEDTEIVSKLMKVYQDRTGDTASKPITMGGGTYARHLPNAVSFGPEGIMDVCGCHIPDEHITKDQLMMTTKMIADAIIALACEE